MAESPEPPSMCSHGTPLAYRCNPCEGWTDMSTRVPVNDEAEAALVAEAIAKAQYETVGHDLTKYPWDDETANQGHKAAYRELGARLAPIVVAELRAARGEDA